MKMNAMECVGPQTAASSRRYGLIGHIGLLALVPAILLIPVQGMMLIVPVAAIAEEESLVWATRAGARVIGRGPLPGSVVVDATLGQLWLPALGHGALLIRSDGAGCGANLEY